MSIDEKVLIYPKAVGRYDPNFVYKFKSSHNKRGHVRYSHLGYEYSYEYAHKWIAINYGKANTCENDKCGGASSNFQWSNISRKYKLDRNDWWMLCRPCHAKFDVTEDTRRKQRDNVLGTENPSRWKSVAKCEPITNEIIEIYSSVTHASIVTGVHRNAISNNLIGISKLAGGYKWQA